MSLNGNSWSTITLTPPPTEVANGSTSGTVSGVCGHVDAAIAGNIVYNYSYGPGANIEYKAQNAYGNQVSGTVWFSLIMVED